MIRALQRPFQRLQRIGWRQISAYDDLSIDTRFATAGCEVSDVATGAISPPIHLSTTFERDDELQFSRGYNYSRIGNPTRNLLEKTFAELEKGTESFAFGSGMQAATSILMCYPQAHIILPDDLYHGVYVILLQIFDKWGVTYEKIDMTNHLQIEEKLRLIAQQSQKNVILWLETPSNPLLKVTDIEKVCKISKSLMKETQLCVVVDATWATPYLVRPLELGADVVLHSTTKYINGHSDVTGGIVTIGNTIASQLLSPLLKCMHQVGGGVSSPFDAWMTLRGLRSLPVRMRQHCQTAKELAEYLHGHECVTHVYYPGLASHPQHNLARDSMNGLFGGMLSFLVKSNDLESTEEALQVNKANDYRMSITSNDCK